MNRTNLPKRIAALEQAAPEAVRAWVQVIMPDGLTPEQAEAWEAAEEKKLPPGTGLIVRRYV
jgi:hypothetical protein